MRKFAVVLMISCLMSISQAVVLDFEEVDSLDDWEVFNGTIELSTTGVTSGTQSMKYTLQEDNYWGLRWNAPEGEIPEIGRVSFDITRYAADWAVDQWANIGQALALGSDGPSGWAEFNPVAVIDRTTGEVLYEGDPMATATDWGSWMGDTEWTIIYDCSSYDATGATYFFFQVAANCAPIEPGISYIDNFQMPIPAPRNPSPPDGGYAPLSTDLSWTNAFENADSVTVWFGDPNEVVRETMLSEDTYKTLLTPVYTEDYPGATSTCPNANIGTLISDHEYTWCVETEPNALVPFWTFTASLNDPPVADAGADQDLWGDPSRPNPVVATLDGSGSSDDGVAEPLTFTWVQTAGPDAKIDDSDAEITTVDLYELANSVEYWNEDLAGDAYVFELTVFDGQIYDTDTVVVTVSSDSCVASAEAGSYYYYADIASADGVGDEYRDCKVDLNDFAEMALNWLNCSNIFETCD